MTWAATGVCVIIPAFDAAKTVARAVASALAQEEVGEVIVIDDGSRDDTAAAARAAEDGSGRLKLIRFDTNRGPSAARNAAIAAGTAPFIAVLDADDYFLPRRFAHLADGGSWDLLADNIVFLTDGVDSGVDQAALDRLPRRRRILCLAEFVVRNISRRGRPRAELGFLKPLIRREALARLGLHYDERLRLGEDFVLYARALARGARFEISARCGYVAVERPGSLSGRHRTADLAALAEAERGLLIDLPPGARRHRQAIEGHLASIRRRLEHRLFLDRKAAGGIGAALAPLIGRPRTLAGVAADILGDKLQRPFQPSPRQRLLFEPSEFSA